MQRLISHILSSDDATDVDIKHGNAANDGIGSDSSQLISSSETCLV